MNNEIKGRYVILVPLFIVGITYVISLIINRVDLPPVSSEELKRLGIILFYILQFVASVVSFGSTIIEENEWLDSSYPIKWLSIPAWILWFLAEGITQLLKLLDKMFTIKNPFKS